MRTKSPWAERVAEGRRNRAVVLRVGRQPLRGRFGGSSSPSPSFSGRRAGGAVLLVLATLVSAFLIPTFTNGVGGSGPGNGILANPVINGYRLSPTLAGPT